MRRLGDVLCAVFVSPEALVVAMSVAAYLYLPECLAAAGSRIDRGPDAVKCISLVPLALLLYVLRDYRQMLFPDLPLVRDHYQRWPHYHMVSDRYFIIVVVLALCTFTTGTFWLFHVRLSDPLFFSVFSCSILLAIVAFWSFFMAKVNLERLLMTASRTDKQ